MIPFGHRYKRKAIARGMDSAPPEEHYLPMMVGGVVLPVSVCYAFVFAWIMLNPISPSNCRCSGLDGQALRYILRYVCQSADAHSDVSLFRAYLYGLQ